MKNFFCILMISILMLSMSFPIRVRAAELPLLTNGYTEDGIYYEVYGEDIQPDATTLPVTRYVTYKGNVTPPAQLPWQETINGIKYSGTLTLVSYGYIKKDDITTATYMGSLTYYLNQ